MHRVDVVVVGAGGVSGAGVLRALCTATNAKVVGLEQYGEPGMVNSHPLANAGTGHRGVEPNYPREKIAAIYRKSGYLWRTVRAKQNPLLAEKTHHMILGVGKAECAILKERYKMLLETFAALGADIANDLEFLDREGIQMLEPKVIEGRNENEEVCAILDNNGLVVDFQVLARELLNDAKQANPDLDLRFNTQVDTVSFDGEKELYRIETDEDVFLAKALIVTCGADSLAFAQRLNAVDANDHSILSIAGNFWSAPAMVNGKVYRYQAEGIPFSNPHADKVMSKVMSKQVGMSLGPTIIPVLFTERNKWGTVPGFLWLWARSPVRGIRSLFKVLFEKGILGFAVEQFFDGLPIIGKKRLLGKFRKIIPTLREQDITKRKGAGGIRPQLVNLVTGTLEMGNKIFKGFHSRFVTTPSPGASIAVAEGMEVAKEIIAELGPDYFFDEVAFESAVDGVIITASRRESHKELVC